MRELKRWNNSEAKYEPYFVPDEWDVRTLASDMDEVIQCVQCGTEIKAGMAYTSQEVHTAVGFGYMVCPKCHEMEMNRRVR